MNIDITYIFIHILTQDTFLKGIHADISTKKKKVKKRKLGYYIINIHQMLINVFYSFYLSLFFSVQAKSK